MSFQERIKKVQSKLQEIGCDAFLIDDTINLYYLTGIEISTGKLLVHTRGSHLFVDGRYIEMCKKKFFSTVVLITPTNKAFNEFFKADGSFIKTLGFNSDITTYKDYIELQSNLKNVSESILVKPIDGFIKKIRMIKNPEEIQLLREAGELGSQGYDFVCTILKEGITEAEVAAELEIFWKRRGSKSLGFDPIIAFGENSSMPHYRAGNVKLVKGNPVLIDIGVNYKSYYSDMTRMFFYGTPHPEMSKIYEIVKQAQMAALNLCKPGTIIGDIDKAARDLIAAAGYGDRFNHGLGHGVGLEIHEMPTIRNIAPDNAWPLEQGMVITIEPGIYLPGIGGVRIEDTIVITHDGHENLTNRSKELRVTNIP